MAQLGLVMPCLLLLRKEDRFHVQPVSWNMAPEKRYEYDRSMRQKECVSKMYGRRITLRKHEEEPFDKCTSEYYSCSRKGLQSRKNSYKFRRNLTKNEFDDSDAGDLLEHSSNIYDVDGPDVSSSSEDNAHECQRNASKCDCSSVKKGDINELVNHCLINERHHQQSPVGCDPLDFNACHCSNECSMDMSNADTSKYVDTSGIDELHSTSLQSSGSENCLLFERVYKFGYASQRDSEEDPSFAVLSASGRPLAAAKGSICHKRVFPPPLSLVATQSYCAKSGLSPNACTAGAGYCLRSIRCNGRFMLQEVKAPKHKYFRVLREDGRLKLDLLNMASDSGTEEDKASISANAYKAERVNDIRNVEDSELKEASKERDEGTLTGSASSSTPHDELLDPASDPQVEEAMSLESKAAQKLGTHAKSVPAMGIATSPKHMISEARTLLEMKSAKPSESPSSPRCVEMKRGPYNGPSSGLKSSWTRPISAF